MRIGTNGLIAISKNTNEKRMSQTDVIIIDEISMMENLAFQRLSEAMKAVRKNHNQLFGGVQVSNS
jgi:nucleoside-triphosphatase THEP1